MEMYGGEYLLFSLQRMGKISNDAYENKVNVQKERFRAMCFFLWSDETHYGEMLEGLKKREYKGRYVYPETVTGTNEILIRNSIQVGI